ncbi:MAG TPA: hypothetical protein VIF62_38950, partial [Labilithrix sp.]
VAACGTLTGTSSVDGSGDAGNADGDAAAPSMDASTTSDASTPDANAPDADAGKVFPIDPGVVCESTVCDPTKDVCCIGLPPDDIGSGCLPLAEAGSCMGPVYECDDLADCARAPGTICCGQHGSAPDVLTASHCQSRTVCKQTDFPEVLCDPDSEQPCPGGEKCAYPDGGRQYALCAGLP